MRVSEIKEHLDQKPFLPFRIHVSDGATLEVPHPEFVLVTKWALHVAHDPGPGELPERVTRIPVEDVTRIEEAEPTTDAG